MSAKVSLDVVLRWCLKVDLMIDDLKTTLRNEISNKMDNYKVFVEKEVNISEELESYIQNPLKAYGTKIVGVLSSKILFFE